MAEAAQAESAVALGLADRQKARTSIGHLDDQMGTLLERANRLPLPTRMAVGIIEALLHEPEWRAPPIRFQ